MITETIIQGNGEKLILFFSGWGMDSNPFLHLKADNETVCIVYNYSDMFFDTTLLDGYKEIHLIAWSMGVWAAAQVLQGVPLTSAIAINGTEYPVDDTCGIPVTIFKSTLETFSEEGLKRFNRRMCQNKEVLNQFISAPVTRTLDDIKKELACIGEYAWLENHCLFWTRVIISLSDRIFPVANLTAYWTARCPVHYIDAPHYPFYLWNKWNNIQNEWKRV